MSTYREGSAADTRRGVWAALATLAAVALIDLRFIDEASIVVTLVFGPFVASALASVRATVMLSILATLLAVLFGWIDGTGWNSAHLARVSSVFAGGVLATWLAVQRTAREAKLQSVTRVAEVAQQTILRELPSTLSGVGLAARYCSAAPDANIGGDFYEALDTPFGVRLLVGDVRGKGLEAVRLASTLLGEFRSRGPIEPELPQLATLLDEAGVRQVGRTGEEFATAILAELSPPKLALVRCGHPFPLVAEESRVSTVETEGSLPLCLDSEKSQQEVTVAPGSRLLFYSDGAFESRDSKGREFDLAESFSRHAQLERLEELLEHLLQDLVSHSRGNINDDVVLLVVEVPDQNGKDRSGS